MIAIPSYTRFRFDATSTTSTASSSYDNSYSTCTYTNIPVHKESEEEKKKIKELLRKKIIQNMKDQWSEFKQSIKPLPLRPTIQLRGVSFGGRGWA